MTTNFNNNIQKYTPEQIEQYTESYEFLRRGISRVSWSSLDEYLLARDIENEVEHGFPIDFVPPGATERLLEQCQKVFSPATTTKLIEVGAEVDAVNAKGETALIMEARLSRWTKVIEAILPRTKKINAKDNNGHTAFYYLCREYLSCRSGYIDDRDIANGKKIWKQIHLLLDAGADPVINTWTGCHAERRHKPQVVLQLKKRIVTYLQQREEMKTKTESGYDYEL